MAKRMLERIGLMLPNARCCGPLSSVVLPRLADNGIRVCSVATHAIVTIAAATVTVPKCQSLAKAQWLEDRQQELLPTPYFHNVFTLPHELNGLVLYSEGNRRALWGLLFQAASENALGLRP